MSASVLRSARVISVLTLVSRVLGLVRDMVFSYMFGVGSVQSAFALGYQIPNLFRRLFGEGALSAASVPVLTQKREREGLPAMDALTGRLLGILFVTLTVVCILAEVVVIGLYWRYRDDSNTRLTLLLTGIMLPYVVLVCPTAIMGGILNIFGRFALPAGVPSMMNVFLITAALLGPILMGEDPSRAVIPSAVAIVIGGVVQLMWHWQALRRCGLRVRVSLDYRDPGIRRIMWTMLPMIAGLGAVQLNTLADSLIAWWFVIDHVGPGMTEERPGTAILYFAQRLYQFPLGVFLVALATAIFPTLSRYAALGDLAGLGRTLLRGIRSALFIAMPCMIGLVLIREPMVRVMFAHGAFKAIPDADVRVASALAWYSIALWAYGVNHLIIRAFYAIQDANTPLKTGLLTVVLNLALNLILVRTSMREAGLALATSVGAIVQMILLLVIFKRRIASLDWTPVLPSILRTLLASAIMGGAVLFVDRFAVPHAADSLRLLTMVVTGAVAYLAAVWLLKCDELRELLRR